MNRHVISEPAVGRDEDLPRRHCYEADLCYGLLIGTWVVVSTSVGAGREAYIVKRTGSSARCQRALSRRECTVLFFALRGHANKWIAAELGISKSAVSTLLERARRKLAGEIPERLLRALAACAGGERNNVICDV